MVQRCGSSACLYRIDKELWFDFGPSPRKGLSQKDFKRHFGHLLFDTALQYVAFPDIRLVDEEDQAPDMRHQGRKVCLTRLDATRLKFLFNVI